MSTPSTTPTPERSTLVGDDGGPLPAPGGTEDTWIVERASASPLPPDISLDAEAVHFDDVERVDPGMHGGVAPSPTLGVEALQQWFVATVTDPNSVVAGARSAAAQIGAAGTRIDDIITASPRMSAKARIDLYRYSYFARLVECLVDDYPTLHQLLGHHAFDVLARAYIHAHPSRGPNLNTFGAGFASFVQQLPDTQAHKGLLVDLARLEWALVEVIHAAPSPTASFADLAALPPEAGANLRFTPASTLRFLEFQYPANRYLQDTREERQPTPPAPAWSATAIYRHDWRLWRMDFTPPMAAVLRGLLAGQPLGAALAVLEAQPATSIEGDVTAWFRAWVTAGFFATVEI
jgi:hypothetical protein